MVKLYNVPLIHNLSKLCFDANFFTFITVRVETFTTLATSRTVNPFLRDFKTFTQASFFKKLLSVSHEPFGLPRTPPF